jgi:hypothetical protein
VGVLIRFGLYPKVLGGVYYGSGQFTTYTVNQQAGGSAGYKLGTFALKPTTHDPANYTVLLTDDADGYVIADAVMWELQP